jgi:hypothetical protein
MWLEGQNYDVPETSERPESNFDKWNEKTFNPNVESIAKIKKEENISKTKDLDAINDLLSELETANVESIPSEENNWNVNLNWEATPDLSTIIDQMDWFKVPEWVAPQVEKTSMWDSLDGIIKSIGNKKTKK